MPAPSKAQRAHLERHAAAPDGYIEKFSGVSRMNYTMVGKMRDNGWIEIEESRYAKWPWSWKGTRITEAGRKVLEA